MTKAELTVIMASVKSYVEGRLATISERQGPAGEPGEKGEPGRDASALDVEAIVLKFIKGMPTAKDGRDGADGINGVDGAPGRDGIDGKDGPPGRDGLDGKNGERGEDGADGVSIMGPKGDQGERGLPGESIVGPVGPQGERGFPGESIQGPKGDQGERGIDGSPGKDAILPDIEAIAQRIFEAGFARWAVDMERRAQDVFQRAIDKMPVPKDGKDGLGPEYFNLEHDGDGNVTFSMRSPGIDKSWDIRFPRERHKGVFTEGQNYRAGDSVSFGGSLWIATRDDPRGKPGDQNTDWILAVKKGRDGRDGINPPPNGPVNLK